MVELRHSAEGGWLHTTPLHGSPRQRAVGAAAVAGRLLALVFTPPVTCASRRHGQHPSGSFARGFGKLALTRGAAAGSPSTARTARNFAATAHAAIWAAWAGEHLSCRREVETAQPCERCGEHHAQPQPPEIQALPLHDDSSVAACCFPDKCLTLSSRKTAHFFFRPSKRLGKGR